MLFLRHFVSVHLEVTHCKTCRSAPLSKYSRITFSWHIAAIASSSIFYTTRRLALTSTFPFPHSIQALLRTWHAPFPAYALRSKLTLSWPFSHLVLSCGPSSPSNAPRSRYLHKFWGIHSNCILWYLPISSCFRYFVTLPPSKQSCSTDNLFIAKRMKGREKRLSYA